MLRKEQAEKILKPHYEKLKQSLDGGWESWQEYYKPRHHVLDARARAAIVYCEVIDRAKTLFADVAVAKFIKKRGMHLLYIGNEIVLRFKKLRKGAPSNVRTRQQTLFQMQRTIPGVLPGTYASAGYQLDQIEQAIDKTMVVCQLDGESVWAIDLSIGEGEQKVEIMAPVLARPKRAVRVRPRKVMARQETSKKR